MRLATLATPLPAVCDLCLEESELLTCRLPLRLDLILPPCERLLELLRVRLRRHPRLLLLEQCPLVLIALSTQPAHLLRVERPLGRHACDRRLLGTQHGELGVARLNRRLRLHARRLQPCRRLLRLGQLCAQPLNLLLPPGQRVAHPRRVVALALLSDAARALVGELDLQLRHLLVQRVHLRVALRQLLLGTPQLTGLRI